MSDRDAIECAGNTRGWSGAGDRDRTGMASLEGWGSTIELHPRGAPTLNQLEHPKPRKNSGSARMRASRLATWVECMPHEAGKPLPIDSAT